MNRDNRRRFQGGLLGRGSRLLTLAALLGGLVAGPAILSFPATAQAPAIADLSDTARVVARVNGAEITVGDIIQSAQSLPAQYQQQLPIIFPALVEREIDMRLLASAGRAQGLADDATVKQVVAAAELAAIRQIYMEQKLEAGITDAGLKAAYETYLTENPAEEEAKARHILLKQEAEAKAVIDELDGGADFATLAKEKSTGPSAPRGGDLGYFTAGTMVPEFSEAAFALEPGSYTKEPVKSQFGWHVILVEDKRVAAQPSFEEVEPQLRQQLSQEIIADLTAALRQEADVEVLAPAPSEEGAAATEAEGETKPKAE
tara:strand:+ start:6122 stop:7072 length:951 start_codon:yes stop_codon:yes gene_type:complete